MLVQDHHSGQSHQLCITLASWRSYRDFQHYSPRNLLNTSRRAFAHGAAQQERHLAQTAPADDGLMQMALKCHLQLQLLKKRRKARGFQPAAVSFQPFFEGDSWDGRPRLQKDLRTVRASFFVPSMRCMSAAHQPVQAPNTQTTTGPTEWA